MKQDKDNNPIIWKKLLEEMIYQKIPIAFQSPIFYMLNEDQMEIMLQWLIENREVKYYSMELMNKAREIKKL